MIKVVNKRKYDGPSIYVGRPTPLGNPYLIGVHGTRNEVIAKYRDWLNKNIGKETSAGLMFQQILTNARAGNVTLSCWCAPLPCHADVIAELVEARIQESSPT